MNKSIYRETLHFAIKIALVLSALFMVIGTVKAFANTNEEYRAYYDNDANFSARFKPLYISGYGAISTFNPIFRKNSNYLKNKNGCSDIGLPLFDNAGNKITNSVTSTDIPALCNITYGDYVDDGTGTGTLIPTTYSMTDGKMILDFEGGYMWGVAIGLNTRSAFRAEIAYNSFFKSLDNDGAIKGFGQAESKIDNNNYNISFESRSLMLNAYFDMLTDRRDSPSFVPYLMIGAGFADNELTVSYDADPTDPTRLVEIPSNKNFRMAYSAGVGFSSSVSNYIVLDISFRYFNFGTVETANYYMQNGTKNQFQGLTGKLSESYQIMMGLRFQI